MLRMWIKNLLLLLFITHAPIVMAGFSTYTNKWPDDAASVDEKVYCPPSTQNQKPVVTDNTTKENYSEMERISEQKRLYAKFGAAFTTAQIRNIQNISTSSLSSLSMADNLLSKYYTTWEAGLGTKINMARFELSYIYEKDLAYSPNPVFVNNSTKLSSKIMNQGLWLSLLWDWDGLKIPYLRPYIGALGGFIWNKTVSTFNGGITNGREQSHNRYVIGWGGTIGLRMAFWTRWFFYLDYKYLDQGKVVWVSNDGLARLKGYSVVQTVNLGVQYLLG